jgi:5-methylcytosine-specific restriction endonuclease McrA
VNFFRSKRWLRLRAACLERDDFRCRRCGRSADGGAILNADHVIPRSKGGLDVLENLQTLCDDCNAGKGASDPTPHDLRPPREPMNVMRAWTAAVRRIQR